MSQTPTIDEIDTFNSEIENLNLKIWELIQFVKEKTMAPAIAAVEIDRAARDISAAAGTIKDFAHKLKTEAPHA